ncbi:carbohydrate ABC transporter permease [Plantibacter sp. ME-Dv--P-122b]|uniref:carbohydrate ABC transporter permease n=1 Tax=Plantibacter sp. ME-Dv--P-122b TaxID=3040300 RepID=UPI00254DAE56|nr:carbohydrate ABC transporter permease [Plantibacter sp. ME-Dv--P-122b]
MVLTRRLLSALTSVLMIALACLVALPFYYVVINTFKTQADMSTNPLGLPATFTWENYIDLLSTSTVFTAFLNTVYVTVVSVVLMVLIGAMAAFAMIYRRSRLSLVFGGILLAAFLIPYQTTIIPLYKMIVGVGAVDTLEGLIATYLAGSVFCYFLTIGYMRTVPLEIIEAARIDGASPFRIFGTIILPLISPVLVTVSVFQTMWVWNDYVSPTIFLSSPEKNTLVLLASRAVSEFSVNWPAFMAVTVVVLLPMLIFFLAMQKYIVNGLVSGSVKG